MACFSIPDSKTKGSVSLGTVATAKSFNGRNDVLAVVSVNLGEGTSQYLVLFEDKNGTLTQKSIAYMGKGLDVRGIVTADLGANTGTDYIVSVSSLTQKPGVTSTFIIPVEAGQLNSNKALNL